MLKKKFEIPTADYLYEPEYNIEMGVHYIYLLRERYYHKVTNLDNRNLCIIASYNAGAGNVACAMIGNKNINKAIPKINSMTYSELFVHLEKNLPKETQRYIRKVTERMDNFKKWLKY